MTWDKIIPEPVGSLAVFLLLAGTILPAVILTAIVLFGNRRYWLATGTYLLGIATVFNGLVVYAYTPNEILAQWQDGTWADYVAAERLASVNYLVMFMFTILTIVLMVILFRIKQDSLAFMWLGVSAVEDLVNTLYGHYATAAATLGSASSMPRPMSGWAVAFWLSLAGFCFLVVAMQRWRGVPMAVLRKVAIRKYGSMQLPFPVFSTPLTEPIVEPRFADHMDFTVPPQQFLRQHLRTPGGEYRPVPYGIPRFRDQQRRWRRSMWRERRKYLCAVFMYCMQFYAPPLPPDYRYYELHEFYW